jgi:hypothetical protein
MITRDFLRNMGELKEIVTGVQNMLIKKLSSEYTENDEKVKKTKELFRNICEISLLIEISSGRESINVDSVKNVLDSSIEFINEEMEKYSRTLCATLPVDLNASVNILNYTMDKLISTEANSRKAELQELYYKLSIFRRHLQ